MCGIGGIVSNNSSAVSTDLLQQMAAALAHRGPDGSACWMNSDKTAGFTHTRLAVIDLSAAAAQPMHYQHYSITYNGEIYNYLELRETLIRLGYRFTTHSDTEVILAAYSHYKEACLAYLDGMFAFAIWDDKEKVLFAARDRFGEKPFFYHLNHSSDRLLFGSEMKALWAIGAPREIDHQVLFYFLGTGLSRISQQPQRTFYKQIFSLPPAHYLRFNLISASLEVKKYWKLTSAPQPISAKQAVETFTSLFNTAVQRRLRSDVPVATSLSGGLDSSAIAATIQQKSNGAADYKTFSVVFPGFEKDESAYIAQVAGKLGLDNITVSPGPADFAGQLQQVFFHQEEPFGSASVNIQFALAKLAKANNLKVLLDGQGADEILGGYGKYIPWYLQELLSKKKWRLFYTEKNLLLQHTTAFTWSAKNYLAAFFPEWAAKALIQRRKKILATNPELTELFIRENLTECLVSRPVARTLNDVLYHDTTGTSLEELLRFADRNSMAYGLELRLPFLSHQLVEFVFSLPPDLKIRSGYTKWILREAVKDKLPASVVWRKDKIGFEPPQLSWMRDPAIQQLIYQSRKKLAAAGIIKKELVNQPVRPSSAYAAESPDWRYLMAGMLF